MTSLKEFEPKNLTQQQLSTIAYVLTSPAYADVFEPYLLSVRNSMAHGMLDRSSTRKDAYPDDFLAGGITTIDGLLSFFRLLIEETDIERIHEAMQANQSSDVIYHQRAQRGEVQPVVGINQPALAAVLPPEEDF